MLKHFLTFILLSAFSWGLMGQCPTANSGWVILQSQAEVDDFVAMYPNCTDINGQLQIGFVNGGTMMSDITDISGLVVESVSSALWIENNLSLNSLSGLENLTSIGGPLYLIGNGSLGDISALSSLSGTITGQTRIWNNASLTSLNGLEGISEIADLFIDDHANLTDISALSNAVINDLRIENNSMLSDCAIASVCTFIAGGGSPSISGNAAGCSSQMEVEDDCNPPTCPMGDVILQSQADVDAFVADFPDCTAIEGTLDIGSFFGSTDITDISGLSTIVSVGEDLRILDNGQLGSLAGLGSLASVGGELAIFQNPMLTNLDGLSNLTSVVGDVTVTNNIALTSIDGMSNFMITLDGGLIISGNTALSTCDIDNLCTYLASPITGTTNISDNGAGCSSTAEVETACNGGDACPPAGDVVLASQAEVDAFVADFPGCTTIEGNLIVGVEGGSNDITDVSGLTSITTINGGCYFYGTQLTSFNGVGNVSSLSGECVISGNSQITNLNGLGAPPGFAITNLIITDNPLLTNVTAFSSLTTISGNLIIGGNASLTSFGGLSSLANIGGGCEFYGNGNTDFTGLGAVTSVNGVCLIYDNVALTTLDGLGSGPGVNITDLRIYNNPVLTSIAVFTGLTLIDGDLEISNNPLLTTFTGLDQVTTINGSCLFYNNTSLTTFSALSNVTTVSGSLEIEGNTSVTSLVGLEGGVGTNITTLRIVGNTSLSTIGALSGLTSISSDLVIGGNTALNLFTGLDNLTTIGGGCEFYGNGNSNFIGLSGVTTVNGVCLIYDNLQLTSFTGLGTGSGISITDLQITGNPLLTDMTVFSGLTSISGRFEFGNNTSATSLMGFGSLTTIGGACLIYGNTSLTSIEALSGVTSAGGEVRIENNTQLAECAITSVCNAIAGTTMVTISGNAAGCATLEEVEIACGFAGPDCPEGNVFFNSQADVDAFVAAFPNCTMLPGNLNIGNNGTPNDITDISGLSNLVSIGGFLAVEVTQLTSITALGNITSIGGLLNIDNNALLTSLDGLGNITSMNGFLAIENNPQLTSIQGIANITGFTSMFISNNGNLSTCAVESVCNTIDGGTITVSISGNATDCASVAEVDAICNPVVNCPAGNVVLPSQAAVDFYVANFPNCTTINGNLSIGDGSGSNNITDITGLSNITTVTGNLIIANTSLTSLIGLNNITTVGGNFLIESNTNLVSIQTMTSLTSVNGFFRVENNNSLTSLTGAGNFSGINLVVVINNPMLSVCNIQNVCDYLEIPENLATIANNAAGCDTRDAVETACNFGVPGDCPTDLLFMTQADVDQFLVDHPTCTEITGNIQIGCGILETDITDLTPLSNLVAVGGRIAIFLNPDLTSLDGLDNIVTIGSNLGLWGNISLTSMAGLESLTTIGGSLNLHANDFMTSLTGLDNLTSIGAMDIEAMFSLLDFTGLGSLTSIGGFAGISNNPGLTSLSGLDALTSVGLMLNIKNNPFLASVDGLGALSSVGFDLVIEENMSLSNVSGFTSLTAVGRNLAFNDNDALTDLTGMSSVTSINGFLVIRNNDNLTTLDGLENISEGDISQLYIVGNASLSDCAIDNICAYLAIPGSAASIGKNAGACAVRASVEAACSDGLLEDNGSSSITTGETDIDDLSLDGLNTNTSLANSIELYPNPTNGVLQMRNVVAQQVIVFNPQGQRVAQFTNPGNTLDLHNLSAGVYYLNFTTTEGNYTKRVVKMD